MKKTVRFSVIAAVVLLTLWVSVGHPSHAAKPITYNDASIKGTWGFHAFGNNTGRGVAIVAVGKIDYDGQGGCVVSDTINFDAEGPPVSPFVPPPTGVSRISSECDYHTEPDGSGAVHILFSGPNAHGANDEVHLAFIIEDNANSMRLVRTDQVAIAQGTSRRQVVSKDED